ncbi:hypothetical protein SAMN05877753_10679 [Bacillus oleivorans]|uniref:Uncharacterized protein n=1 Tax=Bacillus oleivorans TaxID=1448271 RepID=A0A285CY63_9BACI|nr:hypothetical protein [Bacillus oleivorans]SNX72479.1 hypothetical protein SAMN05877753_10679 [Bacillus oleivorans]
MLEKYQEFTDKQNKKKLENEDFTTMAYDPNLRVSASEDDIYMHFVGKDSMPKFSNAIRYSFRVGMTDQGDNYPQTAAVYLKSTTYSSGYGLDVQDVWPKQESSNLTVDIAYSYSPVTIGWGIQDTPRWSVNRNSATSHVYQVIDYYKDMYWNGQNGSTDNKKGIDADFYIAMMGGTTNSCYGYSIYAKTTTMNIYTGYTFTHQTSWKNSCIKVS